MVAIADMHWRHATLAKHSEDLHISLYICPLCGASAMKGELSQSLWPAAQWKALLTVPLAYRCGALTSANLPLTMYARKIIHAKTFSRGYGLCTLTAVHT